jgi:hypothetical protein
MCSGPFILIWQYKVSKKLPGIWGKYPIHSLTVSKGVHVVMTPTTKEPLYYHYCYYYYYYYHYHHLHHQ